MLAIQAEQEKLLRQMSPNNNDQAAMHEMPSSSAKSNYKWDPKNISGGPFND